MKEDIRRNRKDKSDKLSLKFEPDLCAPREKTSKTKKTIKYKITAPYGTVKSVGLSFQP